MVPGETRVFLILDLYIYIYIYVYIYKYDPSRKQGRDFSSYSKHRYIKLYPTSVSNLK